MKYILLEGLLMIQRYPGATFLIFLLVSVSPCLRGERLNYSKLFVRSYE